MKSDLENNVERLIEEYLGGRLSSADRTAFERRLEREPELRAEVRLQEALDRSLRASFQPPLTADILARAQLARQRAKVPFSARPLRYRLFVEVAAAAVIGIVIGAGYLVWDARRDHGPAQRLLARQTPQEFYYDRARRDFAPDWVCDDQRFRFTFDYRLGQPLLLARAPDVEMKGLAYSNTLSPNTVNVMMKVDNQGVVVFADRDGPNLVPPARCDGSRLHVFERKIGPLVLYELTPLDQPRVLDLLYIPDGKTSQPAS